MQKISFLLLLFTVAFAGCREKDASDERIHTVLIGKWHTVTVNSQNECIDLSWREYKADGTFAEYDACTSVLDDNAGKWIIDNQCLVITARVFPIPVHYSFYYLSNTYMTITQGKTVGAAEEASNPKVSYKKQ
jgi:hypothetical protein